jgi:hypothetical protein
MSDAIPKETFEGFAVVELMGHRRLAGYARQVELFGAPMLRLDVPAVEGHAAVTQYYGASSIYCLTPTTEEIVLAVCRRDHPAPVHRYELPKPEPAPAMSREDAAAFDRIHSPDYDPDDDRDDYDPDMDDDDDL